MDIRALQQPAHRAALPRNEATHAVTASFSRFITHRSSGIAVRNPQDILGYLERIMSKVGGQRNFGYGKQMAWAGKEAL